MDWIRERASKSVSKLTSFRLTSAEEDDGRQLRNEGDPYASDAASAFSMSNPGAKVLVSNSYASSKETVELSALKAMMAVPPYFETRSGTYTSPGVNLQYGISKIVLILDPETSIFEENIMDPNIISLLPKGSRIHLRSSLGKDSVFGTDRDLAWVAYANSPIIPLHVQDWPENGVMNTINVSFSVSFERAQLLASLDYYKSTIVETDIKTFMNMFVNLSADRIKAPCTTTGPVSPEYRTQTLQPPTEILARLCLFYHEPIEVLVNDF